MAHTRRARRRRRELPSRGELAWRLVVLAHWAWEVVGYLRDHAGHL